ncbi:hypothetical protein YTPLAS21_09510 [Candidatus Nitrosocosmicus sp.]|nr:hypothetical protein YTPLAS21_09510 [Candidatus Nitrosocosmicus sp.]
MGIIRFIVMKFIILPLIATVILLGPLALSTNNSALAQNSVFQGISQEQLSTQLGLCISGVNTFISCNNLSVQNQENTGNNVAGQIGGGGYSGGNFAAQGISQSQTSNQGSLCVSGGSTTASCNNFNSQTQVNYGNNVVGQIR